jgi:hypothetical protein
MTVYTGRHQGYWCRTTLHYRGWSLDEISAILGYADLIDNGGSIVGNYYLIPRVMNGERHLETRRKAKAIIDKLWERVAAAQANHTNGEAA